MKNNLHNTYIGFFLLLLSIGIVSAVDLSDCGTITTTDTYTLTNSIGAGGDCLIIQANDVIIEGNGYTIDGNIVVDIGYDRLILNNNIVTGSVTSPSYGCYVSYLTIQDSVVSGDVNIQGVANCRDSGASGGTLEAYNSILGNVYAHGTSLVGGYGVGNGGAITLHNSVAGIIYAYAPYQDGPNSAGQGVGGTIKIYNSNTSDIDVSAGACLGTYGGGIGGTVFLTLDSHTGTIDVSGCTIGSILYPCTEKWIPQLEPSICKFGTQILTYYDANMCGTSVNLPLNNGSTQTCCVENWIQSTSKCFNKTQQVTYTDKNSCGTKYFLPANNGTWQSCNSCVEDWKRTVTPSTCLSGTQLISYTDSNKCGTTTYLPKDNGTMQTCCVENWIQNLGTCVKSKQLILYIDANSCGTKNYLPKNNGTQQRCKV